MVSVSSNRPGPDAPSPGTILEGRYRLASFLGSDGATWSFAATHIGLSRNVTIEFLAASEREHVRRFRRGARVLGMLRHPNIVAVHDMGMHEERPYVVLEYLGDQTMATRLDQFGPMNLQTVAGIANQLLSALDYIHERRLVHRNISAQHLAPVKDWDGGEVIRLTGFGLAKGGDQASLTDTYDQPEMAASELAHTAPELILDPAGADHRVDVYGAACTVYELLAGRPPLQGKTLAQLARAILQDTPTPIHTVAADAPAELSTILERALAKDPNDRPATIEEFHQELRELFARRDMPTLRPPPSTPPG